MRIAVVTPWFPTPDSPYGGIFVAQQAAALAALGHDVHVVHLDAVSVYNLAPELSDRFLELQFEVKRPFYMPIAGVPEERHHRICFPSERSRGFAARAASARDAFTAFVESSGISKQIDVIHAHVTLPAGHAVIGVPGVPAVVTEHFTGVDRVLGQRQARDMFARVIDSSTYLTVSEFLKDEIVTTLGDSFGDRIGVVANLVDFEGLDFEARDTMGERWLYVGSLSERKNVDFILRVLAEYLRAGRSATLTIVGDGEERGKLEALANELGIHDRVRMVGAKPRSATVDYFFESDLLVHMSKKETFGLTSVEAIACGLPVVALANGGAECAWGRVERAAGAILSPFLSAAQVAEHVGRLVDGHDQLDLRAASSWVREEYASEVIAKQLTSIYEETVG